MSLAAKVTEPRDAPLLNYQTTLTIMTYLKRFALALSFALSLAACSGAFSADKLSEADIQNDANAVSVTAEPASIEFEGD